MGTPEMGSLEMELLGWEGRPGDMAGVLLVGVVLGAQRSGEMEKSEERASVQL